MLSNNAYVNALRKIVGGAFNELMRRIMTLSKSTKKKRLEEH
jgi:hypothetical protein